MKMSAWERALAAITFGCVVLALTACGKKEEAPQPLVTVQTAPAERATIQQIITAQAVLFPADQAAITPKIIAPIKKFYVTRGSPVHRGELLATLEDKDLAAAAVENKGAYDQAQAAYGLQTKSALPQEWQKAELDVKTTKATYDAEQKVYDSRRKLYKEGAMARKELDASAVTLAQAKAQYEMAKQNLAALQAAGKQEQLQSAQGQLTSAKGKYDGAVAQLSYTDIRSPINGVVTDRPYYAGETPLAGTPLFTIMDTSSVTVRAHFAQSEAALLKPGDAATITAPGNLHVPGKVTLVSPALDPSSTTVEIWVTAHNPDGRLRPGSNVEVSIVAGTVSDAIVVPVSALQKTPEGADIVMTVRDNRAQQVPVETGIRQGDRVQITKGLSPGETVIVNGAYALPNNTAVKIAVPPQPGSGTSPAGNGNE